MPRFLSALGALALSSSAGAQTLRFEWAVNQLIPDNDSNAFVSVQTLSVPFDAIGELRVTLETEGGWAGDLYAYLTHDSGFSVLLNRPGRTSTNPFGFAGSHIVTFADGEAADIHLAGPDPTGVVAGIYQPDGRGTDPSGTLDTDSRTAPLSGFSGLDPNGRWVLYMADLSAGEQTTLVRWGLEIAPVPEVSVFSLVIAGAGALSLPRRRRKRRGSHPGWAKC